MSVSIRLHCNSIHDLRRRRQRKSTPLLGQQNESVDTFGTTQNGHLIGNQRWLRHRERARMEGGRKKLRKGKRGIEYSGSKSNGKREAERQQESIENNAETDGQVWGGGDGRVGVNGDIRKREERCQKEKNGGGRKGEEEERRESNRNKWKRGSKRGRNGSRLCSELYFYTRSFVIWETYYMTKEGRIVAVEEMIGRAHSRRMTNDFHRKWKWTSNKYVEREANDCNQRREKETIERVERWKDWILERRSQSGEGKPVNGETGGNDRVILVKRVKMKEWTDVKCSRNEAMNDPQTGCP